jgi:hypothetical protein
MPARKTKSPQDVINSVKSNSQAQTEESQAVREEIVYVDIQMELDIRREHLIMLRANNVARIEYSKKSFKLSVTWIFAILCTCLLSGFSVMGFKLDNSVLIALITTTTINVFAFFILVMKYLFNTGNSNAIRTLKGKRS